MCNDFGVEITEADLAAVDDRRKVLKKELLPDLFVDPFDLKEVARY
jgi:hypothetical protein